MHCAIRTDREEKKYRRVPAICKKNSSGVKGEKKRFYRFGWSGSRGKLGSDMIIILFRWSSSLNLRYYIHSNFILLLNMSVKPAAFFIA